MVARTDANEPSRETIAAAAAWLAQLADEQCSDADRKSFEAWLAEAPQHQVAAERMGGIAERIADQSPVERVALDRILDRKTGTRALAMLIAVGSLGAAVWWGTHDPGVRAMIADANTSTVEQRRIDLASGDAVTLDRDTAVELDPAKRTVTLWRGSIMAEVAHGRSRSFVVRTPKGSARALGTRYSVRIAGGTTIVTVIASRVQACAFSGNHLCLTIGPGQAAALSSEGAKRLPDVDSLAADAWSHGLLYADDRPLVSVVEELNRYRAVPITLDASVQGLRVSGSFPLNDPDRAVNSITAALPVVAEPRGEGVILRARKKS